MKYSKDKVSVIIPTHRRSNMICRAIDSVLNQTYDNLELILVNDNDPEDSYTEELIERIDKYQKDKRFHYIKQKKHINGAVARNLGIKEATGEFIAFLDDDDWWENNKLEQQTNSIKSLSAEYGVVSCRIKKYNGNKLIGKTPLYKDGYVYKDVLMLIPDYATGTLLFRHDYLDISGGFDETLQRHQDLQLLVTFTYKYKLHVVDSFLHCADVSDNQHRPDPAKLMEVKTGFFQSIGCIFEKLDKKEKRCIMNIHRGEIGYCQIRNKEFFKGCWNILLALNTLYSLKIEIIRLYNRLKTKRCLP